MWIRGRALDFFCSHMASLMNDSLNILYTFVYWNSEIKGEATCLTAKVLLKQKGVSQKDNSQICHRMAEIERNQSTAMVKSRT